PVELVADAIPCHGHSLTVNLDISLSYLDTHGPWNANVDPSQLDRVEAHMTNQYLWARIAGPDPNLRAADADRERAAERLRNSHAEGRLDIDELQERLELCYRSKTLGELRELVSDLPKQDLGEDQRSSFGLFRPWRWRIAALMPILFAVIVISAVAGHH